jgi:hypothetical protein
MAFDPESKKVRPLAFRGSTQDKPPSEIFHFGYRKAANDKKVPDPVAPGFVLQNFLSLGELMTARLLTQKGLPPQAREKDKTKVA